MLFSNNLRTNYKFEKFFSKVLLSINLLLTYIINFSEIVKKS